MSMRKGKQVDIPRVDVTEILEINRQRDCEKLKPNGIRRKALTSDISGNVNPPAPSQ